jgi:hypothetical protein
VIKSFLQEAHDYVFGELEPPAMRKKTVIQLVAGSFLYDWHNDQEDEDTEREMAQMALRLKSLTLESIMA